MNDVEMMVLASELQSMLSNENAICDAMIKLGTIALSGDVVAFVNEVATCQQVIRHSVKSNHALIHGIRTRHFGEDDE